MRSFCYPAMYNRLVESHIQLAMNDIRHDQRERAHIAAGGRVPRRMPIPANYIEESLAGNLVIVPTPVDATDATEERNAKIAALVTRPDFVMQPSHVTTQIMAGFNGCTVFGATPAECIAALLAVVEQAPVGEIGEDAGDHMHVMGAQ